MYRSKEPLTSLFPSGSQSKHVTRAVCNAQSEITTLGAPSPFSPHTKILFFASPEARNSPECENLSAQTSPLWPSRTAWGATESAEAAFAPKRWTSNCELSTPPTLPSGFSSATAKRAPAAPGRHANAVGRRGTRPFFVHVTPSSPRQSKFRSPVTTASFVSWTSSHAAPTTNSFISKGSPRTSPVAGTTRLAQLSKAKTQATPSPERAEEWATTCWTPLPNFTLSGYLSGPVTARAPSLPPCTRASEAPSQARHVIGPWVPSTAAARLTTPPAPTSQSSRRPSRHTETMRPAAGHATPTCMSSSAPLPTSASATWLPASRPQMRNFLSPPAVATYAESGDHAASQRLPEMPSGFANSVTSSPSFPS
mmetsp:Transcript_41038/g.112996  ORF Transcript_41038/g.112996 Transcript_41038/m.112996 type:complete len:367 (-) Transcript_41038:754-1854(-)